MARVSWTSYKWYLIVVTALIAAFLLGIVQSVLGYDLTTQVAGFQVKTILGIASGIGAFILYYKL